MTACNSLTLALSLILTGIGTSFSQDKQNPAGEILAAAIKTNNGYYLTFVDAGGMGDSPAGSTPVHTDRTEAGDWEKFTVLWLDPDHTRFALRTHDGHYLTAVNGGGMGGPNDATAPVHTDSRNVGLWERFQITFLPNSQVTIRSSTGRYLTAVNGGGLGGPNSMPIHTDATKQGPWEVFSLEPLGSLPGNPAPSPRDLALDKLIQETHVAWSFMGEVLFPDGRMPAAFPPAHASVETVKSAALEFLEKHRGIWGIVDPKTELKLDRYTPDPGEMYAVAFDQWNHGVPVFDQGISVTFDAEGSLQLVSTSYSPGLDDFPKTPRLSRNDIRTMLAKTDPACQKGAIPGDCRSLKPELGILASDDPGKAPTVLIYRLTLGSYMLQIDANSGAVLSRSSMIQY